MSPSRQETALKLWVVLNRALRSIEKPLTRQVENHGLGLTEFAVLEALYHKGTLPIGALGSIILRTSGSMTYIINKLEKKGLLRRKGCDEDARITYAQLTDEGRMLMDRVFPEHAALIQSLMEGLVPREQQAAIRLMQRMGFYAEDVEFHAGLSQDEDPVDQETS